MKTAHLLFQPYALSKDLILKNRIVMAPMTRNMASDAWVPTQAMADYYSRRTNAGLIITEGTVIHSEASGYSNVPGLFTRDQIHGWQQVTKAVHEKEGHIFSQIWHVGRVSHPTFLNGKLPIAPSETTMTGRVNRSPGLMHGDSRAATIAEIHELVTQYANATRNAMEAGFDGVEIHGANGYLIDQFLHYHTNHRQDEYGGDYKNMARFALEVVQACLEQAGPYKVGIRLSPGAYLNEIIQHPQDRYVFQYLLEQLNTLPLAYVHTGNFDDGVIFEGLENKTMTQFLRTYYHGTLIAAGGYDVKRAEVAIEEKQFDLVAMGRPFIANSDLVHRLMNDEEIRAYDNSMLATLL